MTRARHCPSGSSRRAPISNGLARLVPCTHAEREREAVVCLKTTVVRHAQVVVNTGARHARREPALLLGDERLHEPRLLGGMREHQPRILAVTLLVDPRAVHGDEQPRVRVLVRDSRDPGPVEREVRGHLDVEERDRGPGRVDQRRRLPDRPAVVVTLGCHHDRVVARAALRPCPGELRREIGVVGLQHDLPGVAGVTDDQGLTPATESATSASSSETTSPYFVSMS